MTLVATKDLVLDGTSAIKELLASLLAHAAGGFGLAIASPS